MASNMYDFIKEEMAAGTENNNEKFYTYTGDNCCANISVKGIEIGVIGKDGIPETPAGGIEIQIEYIEENINGNIVFYDKNERVDTFYTHIYQDGLEDKFGKPVTPFEKVVEYFENNFESMQSFKEHKIEIDNIERPNNVALNGMILPDNLFDYEKGARPEFDKTAMDCVASARDKLHNPNIGIIGGVDLLKDDLRISKVININTDEIKPLINLEDKSEIVEAKAVKYIGEDQKIEFEGKNYYISPCNITVVDIKIETTKDNDAKEFETKRGVLLTSDTGTVWGSCTPESIKNQIPFNFNIVRSEINSLNIASFKVGPDKSEVFTAHVKEKIETSFESRLIETIKNEISSAGDFAEKVKGVYKELSDDNFRAVKYVETFEVAKALEIKTCETEIKEKCSTYTDNELKIKELEKEIEKNAESKKRDELDSLKEKNEELALEIKNDVKNYIEAKQDLRRDSESSIGGFREETEKKFNQSKSDTEAIGEFFESVEAEKRTNVENLGDLGLNGYVSNLGKMPLVLPLVDDNVEKKIEPLSDKKDLIEKFVEIYNKEIDNKIESGEIKAETQEEKVAYKLHVGKDNAPYFENGVMAAPLREEDVKDKRTHLYNEQEDKFYNAKTDSPIAENGKEQSIHNRLEGYEKDSFKTSEAFLHLKSFVDKHIGNKHQLLGKLELSNPTLNGFKDEIVKDFNRDKIENFIEDNFSKLGIKEDDKEKIKEEILNRAGVHEILYTSDIKNELESYSKTYSEHNVDKIVKEDGETVGDSIENNDKKNEQTVQDNFNDKLSKSMNGAFSKVDTSKDVAISDKKLEEFKTCYGEGTDKYNAAVEKLTADLETIKKDIAHYKEYTEKHEEKYPSRLLSTDTYYKVAVFEYDAACRKYAELGGKVGENEFVSKCANRLEIYTDRKSVFNSNIPEFKIIERIAGTKERISDVYWDKDGNRVNGYTNAPLMVMPSIGIATVYDKAFGKLYAMAYTLGLGKIDIDELKKDVDKSESKDTEKNESKNISKEENKDVDNSENKDLDKYKNDGTEKYDNKDFDKQENINTEKNESKNVSNEKNKDVDNSENKDLDKYKNDGTEKHDNKDFDKQENINTEKSENRGVEKPEEKKPENPDSKGVEKQEDANVERDKSKNIDKQEDKIDKDREDKNIEKAENKNVERNGNENTETSENKENLVENKDDNSDSKEKNKDILYDGQQPDVKNDNPGDSILIVEDEQKEDSEKKPSDTEKNEEDNLKEESSKEPPSEFEIAEEDEEDKVLDTEHPEQEEDTTSDIESANQGEALEEVTSENLDADNEVSVILDETNSSPSNLEVNAEKEQSVESVINEILEGIESSDALLSLIDSASDNSSDNREQIIDQAVESIVEKIGNDGSISQEAADLIVRCMFEIGGDENSLQAIDHFDNAIDKYNENHQDNQIDKSDFYNQLEPAFDSYAETVTDADTGDRYFEMAGNTFESDINGNVQPFSINDIENDAEVISGIEKGLMEYVDSLETNLQDVENDADNIDAEPHDETVIMNPDGVDALEEIEKFDNDQPENPTPPVSNDDNYDWTDSSDYNNWNWK